MPARIPTWSSERVSVDVADAQRVRAMSVEDRLKIVRALCRDAARLLAAMPAERRRKALEYRDPVSESTRAALRRLRSAVGRKGPR